jgi:polysaccharide biosynthesis/export protein
MFSNPIRGGATHKAHALLATAAIAWAVALSAPAAAQAPAAAAPAEYRLGPGDAVRIAVFQNPDLTLEARLTDGGAISYPLLGALRLGGLGIGAAEKLIADGLRNGGFVRNPQVSLVLTQVRGSQASVLGQVNRPGRYAIESAQIRLTDLLALAGGANAAGADTVVVTGLRGGTPYRAEVELPAVFGPGGRERDIAIESGDVVWVDRQPLVYIYGEVQRPGAIRLERGMTVMQALASGGGPTLRGTEKGLKVHRKAADGSTGIHEMKLSERLREGDVVFVRESLF